MNNHQSLLTRSIAVIVAATATTAGCSEASSSDASTDAILAGPTGTTPASPSEPGAPLPSPAPPAAAPSSVEPGSGEPSPIDMPAAPSPPATEPSGGVTEPEPVNAAGGAGGMEGMMPVDETMAEGGTGGVDLNLGDVGQPCGSADDCRSRLCEGQPSVCLEERIVGDACTEDLNCFTQRCENGVCGELVTQAAGCSVDTILSTPRPGWKDSYSADGKCYCDSNFDHGIDNYMIDTPAGPKTVQEVCEAIGPGPGVTNDTPIYNDIQCGNGPANDAGDEDFCPGRTDQGREGCCTIGPKFDLSVFN